MIKHLISYVFIISIAVSCKNPCDTITCFNGGTCDDGTCLCLDWYEGDYCETEQRTKFFGNYSGSLTVTYSPTVQDVQSGSISFTQSPQGIEYLNSSYPSNSTFKLTTNSYSDIELIPISTSVGQTDITTTGQGVFKGDSVIISFTIFNNSLNAVYATATFKGVK
jgi:hypothetical protein